MFHFHPADVTFQLLKVQSEQRGASHDAGAVELLNNCHRTLILAHLAHIWLVPSHSLVRNSSLASSQSLSIACKSGELKKHLLLCATFTQSFVTLSLFLVNQKITDTMAKDPSCPRIIFPQKYFFRASRTSVILDGISTHVHNKNTHVRAGPTNEDFGILPSAS